MACTPRARSSGFGRCNRLLFAPGDARAFAERIHRLQFRGLMLYRCRNCQYEESRGVLPTASCGMLLLVQMGVCAAILIPSIRFVRSLLNSAPAAIESNNSTGLGWWALLIVPLMMIVGFHCIVRFGYDAQCFDGVD